jgi:hypothetical protein
METIYRVDRYRAILWDGGTKFTYTVRGRTLRRFSRKVETHFEAWKVARKWAETRL